MSEIIHFAHGNGFPSPCYRQLLTPLAKKYEIKYIDRIGHNKNFPVTENWHFLVNELEYNIHNVSHGKPVIALGHSLGGVLSVMLAVEKPELFKAIVLLDSPLIGWFKSNTLRICKKLGLIDRVTPAYQSQARRRYWTERESVISYLRSKPLFKNFTDESLNDYIDYGMEKDEKGGYTLRFNPAIEYQIYRTIPHILFQWQGKLEVPAAIIYGKQSNIVKPFDLRYMKKHYNINSFALEGGHMFPMEHPQKAASMVVQALDSIVK